MKVTMQSSQSELFWRTQLAQSIQTLMGLTMSNPYDTLWQNWQALWQNFL